MRDVDICELVLHHTIDGASDLFVLTNYYGCFTCMCRSPQNLLRRYRDPDMKLCKWLCFVYASRYLKKLLDPTQASPMPLPTSLKLQISDRRYVEE